MRSLSRRSNDGKVAELVTSQHTAAEHARGDFETDDDRDLVSLGGYVIESTIKSNLDFSAQASFDIASRLHRQLPG